MSSLNEGPGYRAFRAHLDTLRAAITDPGHLATTLYAKGLITNGAYQKAHLASLTQLERSEKLLIALYSKIASDEGAFDTFLAVLSQEPVMEELCRKLRESKDEEQEATFQLFTPSQTLPLSPLDLYVSYLKDVYKNDPLPTYDKWPQVKGKKFINLSLLSKCSMEAHKYTKAMFHGDIRSTAPEKNLMEMADIAKTKDGSIIRGRRRCILVQGDPGGGKSTFAWKLCQQWGKGKLLQQYRLVVLLRLREKRVRETRMPSDLFRRCEPAAIKTICQSDGEGVLLVLDGWDELPPELYEKDSFFLDLVQGQELPDATILVTSRPHASQLIVQECQDRIFQHIEIIGFSEDNVQEYIKSTACDDAKLLHDLQTYTSYYPHIVSMMCNPLNAAIVVEVYKNNWKEESTIPKTMTELYSSLIRTLLLRYLGENPVHCKKKGTTRLRQFSDLPPDVYQKLCDISRIAYQGIKNKQQVIFSDLPEDFDSLGLMQCVPELYVDEGAVLSYNFLHLSVQEFLAAFHLSLQSTEKQMEIFKVHQKTNAYKMILKFLAGFINGGFLLSILTGESQSHSKIKLDVDHLLFLFEGKKSTKMLNDLSEVDVQASPPLSQFDCYVLGYMASHTNCKWTIRVDCAPFYVGEMFARGTKEDETLYSSTPIADTVHLSFSSSRLSTSGLKQILTAHPSFLIRTTHLHITANNFQSHSWDILSQSLPSLRHLQSLNLARNFIGSASRRALSSNTSSDKKRESARHPLSTASSSPHPSVQLIKALQSQNSLKSLMLCATGIGLPECAAIAQWLSSPTCSLEELDVGLNDLTSEDTEVLITSLSQNCTLHKFSISNSEISSPSLICVCCLPLVELCLWNCRISPEEAHEIARALRNNTILEELHLSGNPIGDEGATALAGMLSHNKTLKTLYLRDTSLTAQGTKALLQSLQCNCTLRTLGLSKIESLTTKKLDISSTCEVCWM